MTRIAAALFAIPVIVAVAVPPASAQDYVRAAESSLIAAEDAMFAAKVAHDAAAIDRGMADEATYTHGSGRAQTKAEYLTAFADNRADYRSIAPIGRVVRVFGGLGITHATLRMTVGDQRMEDSYLAAYVRRAGRWQLLFWQTTPQPGARPPIPAWQAAQGAVPAAAPPHR